MKDVQTKTDYCLNCINKPCTKGCPLGNDIPQFIALAKDGKYKEAYEVLSKTTVMPFICGKICPKSKQCQGKCVRGIKGEPVSIGDIESFIGDMAIDNDWYLDVEKQILNGRKVAVIGSGPAGIASSIWLAKAGNEVTLYEKKDKIGGILRYGIPDFRLDKKYIDAIEQLLKKLGVIIKTETMPDIEGLTNKFDDVVLCFGANKSSKMGIPGENLPHVLGANELLEYNNHPNYTDKNVIVIGGGNVAIDVARVIKRLGAKEVTIAYRRSKAQMPAEAKEIEEAVQDGVQFLFQVNVKEIENQLVRVVKTELVQKEGETRLVPVDLPETKHELKADYVVMAIGSKLDNTGLEKLKLNPKGYVEVDENFETNLPHIYACGDCIGMTATVAWACYYGRETAKSIINKN